jgi:hypothetical protein
VVDVVNDQVDETLGRWALVLPGAQFHLFAYPWNRARVASFVEGRAGEAQYSLVAEDWPAEGTTLLATRADCWATCAAYDSSGVHVKREIEALLLPALTASGAVLLAHDPAYGIVRVLQAQDVRARLFERSRRVRIYKAVCRTIFGFSWLAARLSGLFTAGPGALARMGETDRKPKSE